MIGRLAISFGFLMFVSNSWSDTYRCEIHGNAVSKGWFPPDFTMEYAPDMTEIIAPVTAVFGAVPFEKGFIGNTLWARGKGRSKSDGFYSYQLQMNFNERTREIKLKMKMAGYHDLASKGVCTLSGGTSSTKFNTSKENSNLRDVVPAKASSGAQAVFSVDRIVIDIGQSDWLRERVQNAKTKFQSYENIKVIEIAVQKDTADKGYGAYDWVSTDSVGASVSFSNNEIEIIAGQEITLRALELLDKSGSVSVGINTGRGWFATTFWKKKGNWK
jgi:hypothetical protein